MKIAQEKAKENDWHVISDTSYAGYSTIPKHVMNGYEVMIYEAVIKQSVRPTHVFLQTGVGSLAAGVTASLFRNLDYSPRIILVDQKMQIVGCNQLSIKNLSRVWAALILIWQDWLVEPFQ